MTEDIEITQTWKRNKKGEMVGKVSLSITDIAERERMEDIADVLLKEGQKSIGQEVLETEVLGT